MKKSNRYSKQTKAATVLLFVVTVIWIASQIMLSCKNASASENSSDIYGTSVSKLLEVHTNPNLEQVIVDYEGMKISFNPRMHIPNWVAWELTGDETLGEEPRYNKFACDESVPGCPDDWDYKYSGYDRGHMAPAADMKWSERAMRESFYLTNVCPQAGDLNRGSWKRLEEKCRAKACADSTIIVICGPVLTDNIREFLGDSRVAVPQRFFKVILSPFAEKNQAIGFIMPNGKVPGGMQNCAVSIDSVEAVTGHDFFPALPTDVQDYIESLCNFNSWSRSAGKRR